MPQKGKEAEPREPHSPYIHKKGTTTCACTPHNLSPRLPHSHCEAPPVTGPPAAQHANVRCERAPQKRAPQTHGVQHTPQGGKHKLNTCPHTPAPPPPVLSAPAAGHNDRGCATRGEGQHDNTRERGEKHNNTRYSTGEGCEGVPEQHCVNDTRRTELGMPHDASTGQHSPAGVDNHCRVRGRRCRARTGRGKKVRAPQRHSRLPRSGTQTWGAVKAAHQPNGTVKATSKHGVADAQRQAGTRERCRPPSHGPQAGATKPPPNSAPLTHQGLFSRYQPKM